MSYQVTKFQKTFKWNSQKTAIVFRAETQQGDYIYCRMSRTCIEDHFRSRGDLDSAMQTFLKHKDAILVMAQQMIEDHELSIEDHEAVLDAVMCHKYKLTRE